MSSSPPVGFSGDWLIHWEGHAQIGSMAIGQIGIMREGLMILSEVGARMHDFIALTSIPPKVTARRMRGRDDRMHAIPDVPGVGHLLR